MATKPQTATAFFMKHAGYSVAEGETREQGRRRCAKELAAAERWLMEQPGHTVAWEQDRDYDPADSDVPDMPEIGWGCIVSLNDQDRHASLWSVTFDGDGYPAGNPYARVVVAELAAELMHE